jgi:hypothetical protein
MTHRPEKEIPDRIVERLRNLPELTPPADLRPGIMASLAPKKPGWMARLRLFLVRPQTITFVPIKWAPALAVILLLAVVPRWTSMDNVRKPVAETATTRQASLTLTFEHPDARQVALIGTFNRWMPDGLVKTEKRGDVWIFHVDVEPGRYEYAFLVDGQEIVPDPQAAFSRNNGFGTPNSIVYATANGQNQI